MRRAARFTVTGATGASSLETRMDAGFQPRFFAVTTNSDLTAKNKMHGLSQIFSGATTKRHRRCGFVR